MKWLYEALEKIRSEGFVARFPDLCSKTLLDLF